MGDNSASYDFGYDNLGRTNSIVENFTGLTGSVGFTQLFDATGNHTQLASTIGDVADFTNDYTYDLLGRETSISQHSAGGHGVTQKRVDFSYYLDGQYKTVSRYANTAGTQLVAASSYTYDATGRLTGLVHKQGATTLANYAWTYDATSRLTTFTNALHTGESAVYGYYADGQLASVTYGAGGLANESYTYDDNGNRNNGGFVATTNNQLLTDGTYNYAYDFEGNITSRTRITGTEGDGSTYRVYEWDNRNRLISVTDKTSVNGTQTQKVTYSYDAFDHLVGRKVFLRTCFEID